MLRWSFILISLVWVGCDSTSPVKTETEESYSPSEFQWIELSQLDQLLYEPNYFQPLVFKFEALDSFQKKQFEIHTEINDEPGYRFDRKLFYVYERGRLVQLKEELFYNHKSIHKRSFAYTYNKNTFLPPVVTNETKKISSIIRQFFGLGANAVEMVGLADFQYETVNDSTVFKKSLNLGSNLEEVFVRSYSPADDTLMYGTILNVGTPLEWNESKVKVPHFRWIPIRTTTFHREFKAPLYSTLLEHGNRVNRSFLYKEDGLFKKSIDSVFYKDEFVRRRLLRLDYDSIGLPLRIEVYYENKSGVKNFYRRHAFNWIK